MRNDFKDRMHTGFPEAEQKVFTALSKAGLTKGMVTGKAIQLRPPSEREPHGLSTTPDFEWFDVLYGLYLDGPVHKGKRLNRDDEITALLTAKGWTVSRWSYASKLSDRHVELILELVARTLIELRESKAKMRESMESE